MSQVAHHATACKGCRRRGRKCDRTLPACLSCRRRGVECEGYITRWPGVASRGKLAGKSIPVCDSSAKSSKHRPKRGNVPLSTGSRDMIERGLGHNSNDSHLDIQDLSSIFYLGTGPSDNPMFRYVLPLIDTVPPIRYAIAASASCHLAARTSDKDLEKKSLYLRVHATHLLGEMLRDPCSATDQSILASMLMLAQLDMCSGDCLEFETHLKAAVVIVRAQNYDHASNKHYFEQRLAWLDMMASTTSARLPNLSAAELKTALGRCSNHGQRQWSYDVFPCPIDLFEILADITMLYKAQVGVASPSEEPLEEVDCIKRRLAAWEWPGETSGPRKHMVKVWCLGIMAYLGRLFPSTNSSGAADLTSQVLYHAGLIPPASSWSYSLLWPIFQIGVTLGNEALDDRAWVEKRLNIALEAVGCRHFSNALETLRFVWDSDVPYDPLTTSMNGRTIMLA
ncbi:uncharacterized protein NECHADRAFT_37047 [Fusarium vanettenii 77-13-4]|uniref:Zn(2)-C6 fungal-type domain-containing protein n=1 Tax=Fusarium vanettenii (strain ATCC MYA-4622 / CBS 123669 / FGSC 9596 / NRRL 45880 / 77-13-4) TaxID=660122 RepID=C7ZFE8_FUSV7|nr:uncharacterized protein NECHADRAFT_37047 [Fusarium vanettenii 77-13-4]EEU37233.1 hypothetical protein NECHADRAFT_37047 [Fusarium vanettenii 77-13-4]